MPPYMVLRHQKCHLGSFGQVVFLAGPTKLLNNMHSAVFSSHFLDKQGLTLLPILLRDIYPKSLVEMQSSGKPLQVTTGTREDQVCEREWQASRLSQTLLPAARPNLLSTDNFCHFRFLTLPKNHPNFYRPRISQSKILSPESAPSDPIRLVTQYYK